MCDRCQRNTPQLTTAAIELQSIPVALKVWYLVGMDLIGPFSPTVRLYVAIRSYICMPYAA